jgi:hypothetical protein
MTDTPQDPNYQDILDKYAASLASTKVPPIPEPIVSPIVSPESNDVGGIIPLTPPESQTQLEPVSQPEAIPEPIVSPEPIGEGGSISESIIPPIPPVELPPESTLPEIPQTPKENNFFKYLFFFSLFIFIIVLVSVIISFINSQKSLTNSSTTPTIAVLPTAIPNTVCQINDQSYPVGQTFTATDGCNTCTCNSDLTISCTENTCPATPSVKLTPTKSATTSAKITTTPSDLITAIKAYAIKDATTVKYTADQIKVGTPKIEGNFAQASVNICIGQDECPGYIVWATKVNGIWKVVTGGQEPPACSILKPYNFPSDFSCNQ